MIGTEKKQPTPSNLPTGMQAILDDIAGMEEHPRLRNHFKNNIPVLRHQCESYLRKHPKNKDFIYAALLTGLMRYNGMDETAVAENMNRFVHAHGEFLAKNFKAEDITPLLVAYTQPEQSRPIHHKLDPELVAAMHQVLIRHCFSLAPLLSGYEVLDIGFGMQPPPAISTGKPAQEEQNARKTLELLELCAEGAKILHKGFRR